MHISRRSLLGLAGAGAGALILGACSKDKSNTNANGPQTINWWHIHNTEPMLPVWAAMAKEYETAHPNVKINITSLENEAFKAKLTTVTQAGNPPDLFQSWGGGVLKQQVDATLVKDLTGDTSSWVGELLPAAVQPYTIDGKVYGIPWDIGMVGFWYNKDLFAKAKITAPPATWAEFLGIVSKIKSAGITPIALPVRTSGPATSTGPTSRYAWPAWTPSSRPVWTAPSTRTASSRPVRTSRSSSTSRRSRRASSPPSTARRTARPRSWATATPRWS